MKKLLIFLLLVTIPSFVNAYELECDGDNFLYKDTFNCHIKAEVGTNIKKATGSLTVPNSLFCSVIGADPSLKGELNKKDFTILGTTSTENILNILCKVSSQDSKDKIVQLKIEDFKYEDNLGKENLVLRSDKITLKKFSTATTTKIRNLNDSRSKLKSLRVGDEKFNFSSIITNYEFQVLNDVNSIELEATPENEWSIVEGTGIKSLNVGNNYFDIYVRASDDYNVVTCYTVKVERLAKDEKIYDEKKDATLYELNVIGYDINFDKSKNDYTLKINSEEKMDINYKTSVLGAKVEIINNDSLKNGDVIIVKVTSTDKSVVNEYKIQIKVDSDNSMLTSYIMLGLAGVVIFASIIMFIKTSKNKKKQKIQE